MLNVAMSKTLNIVHASICNNKVLLTAIRCAAYPAQCPWLYNFSSTCIMLQSGKAASAWLASSHNSSLGTKLGVQACWPKLSAVCLRTTQSMHTPMFFVHNVLDLRSCCSPPLCRAMHTTRFAFVLLCAHWGLYIFWSVCTCTFIHSTDCSGHQASTV